MTFSTISPQVLNRMLKRYEAFRPNFIEQVVLKFKGKLRAQNSRLMHDLALIARRGPCLQDKQWPVCTETNKYTMTDNEFAEALTKALNKIEERKNELHI